MGKSIVYVIRDNGVDGRDKTKIVFASMVEEERDRVHAHSKNKAYTSKGEQIVDMEEVRKEAIAKLDGIERLVLGITQREL